MTDICPHRRFAVTTPAERPDRLMPSSPTRGFLRVAAAALERAEERQWDTGATVLAVLDASEWIEAHPDGEHDVLTVVKGVPRLRGQVPGVLLNAVAAAVVIWGAVSGWLPELLKSDGWSRGWWLMVGFAGWSVLASLSWELGELVDDARQARRARRLLAAHRAGQLALPERLVELATGSAEAGHGGEPAR